MKIQTGTHFMQINKFTLFSGIVLISLLSFFLGRWSISSEEVSSHMNSPSSARTEKQQFRESKKNIPNLGEVDEKLKSDNPEIPVKVLEVLTFIRKNKKAPEGYEGGRTFFNREKILPQKKENGQIIKYQEWDVNPKIPGKNRGAERMVSSDDTAYYTSDHYKNFTLIVE